MKIVNNELKNSPVRADDLRRHINLPGERFPRLIHEILHAHPRLVIERLTFFPVSISDTVFPLGLEKPVVVVEILRLAPQKHRFVVAVVLERRRHHTVHLSAAGVPLGALPAAALRLGAVSRAWGGPVGLVAGGGWHVVRGGRHHDRVLVVVVVLGVGDVELLVARHAHDTAAVGATREFHGGGRPVGISRHRG